MIELFSLKLRDHLIVQYPIDADADDDADSDSDSDSDVDNNDYSYYLILLLFSIFWQFYNKDMLLLLVV